MSCEIFPALWLPRLGIPILSGQVEKSDEVYLLQVENVDGPVMDLDTAILQPGIPIAIRLAGSFLNAHFQFCLADWFGGCDGNLKTIELNLPESGFAFGPDGKAVGYTTEAGVLRVFYLNLLDFPVVITLHGGSVQLRFKDDPSHYFEADADA